VRNPNEEEGSKIESGDSDLESDDSDEELILEEIKE
jgi:hypothetical protein